MPTFLAELVSSWKSVVTRPRGFFADMDVAGGFGEPMQFLAALLAANGLVGVARLTIRQGLSATLLIQLAISVFVVGVLVFGASALVQWLAGRMEGAGDFEGTFRAVVYSSAPNLLYWIPFFGLLPLVYSAVLQTLGLAAVHRLPVWKAAVLAVPVHLLYVGVNLGLYAATQ